MRLPKSLNDVVVFTAQDTKHSRKKVLFVIRNLEKNLRKLISDPLRAGLNIKLSGVIRFKFRYYKFLNRVKNNQIKKKDREIIDILNYIKNEQEETVNGGTRGD